MKRFLATTGLFIILLSCTFQNKDQIQITIPELREHITYLASKELKGRMPGTRGDKNAAEYIIKDFKSNNLVLHEGTGKQSFDITLGNKLGTKNELHINRYEAELQTDFTPFPYSGNETLQSQVAFAGYGYQIQSADFTWNDYENIDVQGNWVMLLEGMPALKNKKPFGPGKSARSKALKAKELGAGGILFVVDQTSKDVPDFVDPTIKEGELDLPVIQISKSLANRILKKEGKAIEELKTFYNKEKHPKSFMINTKIDATVELLENTVTTQNVIAKIPGKKAKEDRKYIVIGGHYDHLGHGGTNSGSRRPDTNAIHFGADDNASGIAAMLEIAEKLETLKDSLSRTIIFIGFGAEEQGLIGSKYFMKHSEIDPENIEAMINIDMVGRLREENSLQVGGTGTSKEADSLLKAHNTSYNFKFGFSEEGYGPSDHSSFYSNDIPVFFFSTGPHLDYHTPMDTPDKINYKGLKKVTNYIFDLTKDLAMSTKELSFQEAGPKSPGKAKRHGEKLKVTLGIMPDFAGVEDRGLRADLVIKGKPADRAGMKKGDIITAINGHEIGGIYDYMERLSKIKAGQTITVEIIRDKQTKVLMVQL